MLSVNDMEYLDTLREKECICVEKHTERVYSIQMSHGRVELRSGHKLYKVKEIEIKTNGKYSFKATCKEIGADIETIKVFRLTAYKKVKT